MKELKSYFEGLLDRTSVKVKNIDLIHDIIEQFLKENYDIYGAYIINKTKSRYIVDVKGTVRVKNKDISSLTNEYFEFGSVNREFDCTYCNSLTTLEGAPEEVGGDFACVGCSSIKTLEGAPEEVGGDFACSFCKSLKSLKGAPEKVGGEFDCRNCHVRFKIEDVTRYIKMDVGNICT